MSINPEIIPQGTTFDNVLTVYNITSDNYNRLKPQVGDVLPRKNKEFLNVTNIKKDDIHSHHLIRIKMKETI